MEYNTVIIHSYTYAMKAKQALQKCNIEVKMQKMTASDGCAYALTFYGNASMSVFAELRRLRIPYRLA